MNAPHNSDFTSMVPPRPAFPKATSVHFPAIAFCAISLLVLAGTMALPRISIPDEHSGVMLGLHLLLEIFSVVVAMLVVVMSLHIVKSTRDGYSNLFIFGFTIVAGVDLLHALSYEGMPALLTESTTEKAIFFWLAGRICELVTMLLYVGRVQFRGSSQFWLGAGCLTTVVLFLLGTYRLDLFPSTFIPGEGVTPFKAMVEYALCAGNIGVAMALYRQFLGSGQPRILNLAAAGFAMGVGEIAFTTYITSSDFTNMFGHVFKIVAYVFVYRAMFLASVQEPCDLLVQSEQQLRERDLELNTLLRNVPACVSRLDRDRRYLYVNPIFETTFGLPGESVFGRQLEEVFPKELLDVFLPKVMEALKGERVAFDFSFACANKGLQHRTAILVPERDTEGEIRGVVSITLDTTDREWAQRQLIESAREVVELRAALDAHAIVGVTDGNGIIIHLNDKFCEISKYSREELLGQPESKLVSGHHPRTFFEDIKAIVTAGDVWNGEICNKAKDGSLYWVYSTIVPLGVADGVPARYLSIQADISARKQAEQEARRLAYHDELTGLPNRRLMHDRLAQAIRDAAQAAQYGALLLMDLDHFKEINDTLGHAQGDDLLRQIGFRLTHEVLHNDTVARLGGDEFVVLLGELGRDPESASVRAGDLADKLRESLAQTYELQGTPVAVSASFGVVLFNSLSDNPHELLKQADMALYRAKAGGRNQVSFFDPALQAEINVRAETLRDLRLAIDRDELRLFYQPIADASGRILGVEALVRWQHPVRGLVPPIQFIPLAEQVSLIQPIGKWVLDAACKQLAEWAKHPKRSGWTVAVNVCERELNDPNFVAHVLQTIEAHGVEPSRVKLEITEGMLLGDLDATMGKMQALQARGVTFALDDFGTGYSSLSYLRKLPLDQLKIDKSFVDDVLTDANNASIVRTILSLARALELSVIAEGVETAEQMQFLTTLGNSAFQGYHLCKPVPVELLPDSVAVVAPRAGESVH